MTIPAKTSLRKATFMIILARKVIEQKVKRSLSRF